MENRKPGTETRSPLLLLSKYATALVFIALLLAALWFWFQTDAGARLRSNPAAFTADVQHFIHRHRTTAPLVYLAVYTTFAALALPIWWLQILAGVGFGLYEGTLFSVIGSTLAAGIAVALSRWLAADWFHQHIESHAQRLKHFDEMLGHNGFLFVMTIRLIPLLPFGVFNYALGLTNISFLDAVLGTFLGTTPIVALHVAVGAGYHPWDNWRFDLILGGITLVLLLPLILRYLRPQWFKNIGVE